MTEEPGTSLLRPYLMTSGTGPAKDDQSLEIEAQVMTSRLGAASSRKLTFKQPGNGFLCRNTMSVAEVAGHARACTSAWPGCWVADLAELGYVVVRRAGRTTTRHDLGMIERVIRGLEAIH